MNIFNEPILNQLSFICASVSNVDDLKTIIIPAVTAILASVLTFLAQNITSKRSSKTQMDSIYIENIVKILEQYKEDVKNLKNEIEVYSNENYKLRETIVELQNDNVKLKETNAELIRQNKELLASNEELKSSNIKMQRLLEQMISHNSEHSESENLND